jgi:hypothetical protein
MKRILAGALALFSALTFGATLNPIQLLNPAGSISGQTIVSTGASTAPAWGGIGVSGIAAVPANTVLANATGSSASPTAFAMPSCSGSNNALRWTAGSGFTCASAIALTSGTLAQFSATTSAQLLGVISDETGSGALVFGTNPTISGATISGGTGSFTTLAASSTVSGAGFTTLLSPYAPLASPAFTGTPTAVTQGAGSNSTALATTAFVQNSYAAPPAIGNTTPAAGTFTTLKASNSKVIANTTNAQSIPNNTSTVVTTWTSVLNQGANFVTSTGIYTAPAAGTYRVSAGLQFASATWAAGNLIAIQVKQNGATVYQSSNIIVAAATQPFYSFPINVVLNCAASDTISVAVLQTQGGAVALSGSALANFLMISQEP